MIIYAKDDIVALTGALTKNEWLSIKAAANLLLREHPEGIIVDCEGLENVTEDGARTFLNALRDTQSADARIVVANVPRAVQETIQEVPGVRSRVPFAASLEEARASLKSSASQVVDGQQCVMVPVLEGLDTSRAIEIASDLSRGSDAPLLLLYCIEVGRALPIGAPLPEQEAAAAALLEEAAAQAARAGLAASTHVARVRELGDGLLHEIVKHNASLVIISVGAERFADPVFAGLVDILLTRSPGNVLIARGQPEEGALGEASAAAKLGDDRRQRQSPR